MLKKSKSYIAFLLAVILVFVSVPMSSIALDSGKADHSDEVSENTDITFENQELTEKTQIDEIVEVTSMREESVKHFRRSNGSYEAIYYGEPVHRKDEKGVWQDIDHTLTMVKSSSAQKYTTPDARVTFSDSFKANAELVSLNENGYSISISLLDEKITANKNEGTQTKAVVNNPQKRASDAVFSSIEEAARINHQSSIVYENVKPNTNLEYVLRGNDLKENIIVNAPCESYEYQFQLRLDGLRPELDDKGNVLLCDVQSNQMIYMIPAPYMYDSVYEYSRDVSYKLTAIERDVYQLSIHANAEWINSPDRVFPVTIDPTISENVSYDSYTSQAYMSSNYGYDELMRASNYETAYIRIPLSHLPVGATINDASLNVYYYFNQSTGSMLAGAYQVLEEWVEDEITYLDSPAVSTTSISTAVLTASSSVTAATPGLASFPITNAVKAWCENSDTNFGVAIKDEESPEHTNYSVVLLPYEGAMATRPYISVNYYPAAAILNGIYQIKNVHSGKYMRAYSQGTALATRLQQSDHSYEDRQQFLICHVGNNDYTIQPLHALTLALNTPNGTDGQRIGFATYNADSDAQRFSISVTDDGYYVIKNKKSNYENALALSSGSSSASSTIQQKAYTNNDWQHWELEFVGLESGVYAIKDAESTVSMYSKATGGERRIPTISFDDPPEEKGTKSGLFKIIYRPETQDFVIRSMVDNLIFIYSGDSFTGPYTGGKTNAFTDAGMDVKHAWQMTKAGEDSFYIWRDGADGIRHYLKIPAEGANLTLVTDRNTATKWEFLEYTVVEKGVDFKAKDSHVLSDGTSIDLSSFASLENYSYYSTIIGDNVAGAVTGYSVSDMSDSLTSLATISNTGMLSTNPQTAGIVKVTVSFEAGVSASINFYVEPSSGEYFFLQNIQPSGNVNIGYIDGNSTGAVKTEFTYDDTQIWERIPSAWEGYYYIRNVGTGLYLSSPSTTTRDAAFTMVAAPSCDLQAFQFVPTSSKAWAIRARNHAVADENIYVTIKSASDNTLVQDSYIGNNNSYLDEFNVIMFGGDVVYNRTLDWAFDDPIELIAGLANHYASYSLMYSEIYMDLATAQRLLENSKIAIINGHGLPNIITIHEKPQRYIRNTDIYKPNDIENSLDLSNVDIVIFAGCSTAGNLCTCCPTYESSDNARGSGGETDSGTSAAIHNCHLLDCSCCRTEFNLTKSAEKAGAKVAIGWHVTQRGNRTNDWIDRFFSYMCQTDPDTGLLYTAQKAFDKTNQEVTSWDADKAVLYGTNPNFRLSD